MSVVDSSLHSLVLSYNIVFLLGKLGTFLLEHMHQGLGTLKNLVEGALSLINSLLVLITGSVLLGKTAIDLFESIVKSSHLFFNLSLFFLLLVDQVLNLIPLLLDGNHHVAELGVCVVQL